MFTGKTFFTADLHFGHARILEYCAGRAALWSDVESMNVGLIERWNDIVAPNDRVFLLGDIAMGKRAETVPLLRQCNGNLTVIPGNHDHCWDQGRDGKGITSTKLTTYLEKYREWIGPSLQNIIQPPYLTSLDFTWRFPVLLSHLPPEVCGDHKAGEAVYENEIRFVEHRPEYPPEGITMLCGHVHEAWKRDGRVINVGVDVWDYRPVSTETLISLIESGVANEKTKT